MASENSITVHADGPFQADGDVEVVDAEKNLLKSGSGIWLCRCGASQNKPFCDGRHKDAGFAAASAIPDPKIKAGNSDAAKLCVTVAKNGPLIVDGPVTVRDAAGSDQCHGVKAALCRCGASENKPFCDGAHSRVGFQG